MITDEYPRKPKCAQLAYCTASRFAILSQKDQPSGHCCRYYNLLKIRDAIWIWQRLAWMELWSIQARTESSNRLHFDYQWVLNQTKPKSTLPNEKSDQPLIPDDALAALQEVVSWWCLFACSMLSSRMSSSRWANWREMGSVSALICQATPSKVTDTLGDVSIPWSDILLGACSIKFLVSILISVC